MNLGNFLVVIGGIGLIFIIAYIVFIKAGVLEALATLCIWSIITGGCITAYNE